MTSERFIILCGTSIEPWVANDEIFKSDRTSAVKNVAAGEYQGIAQIIAFDLVNGSCRDATEEIVRAAADLVADYGESTVAFAELVELTLGTRAARPFFMRAA